MTLQEWRRIGSGWCHAHISRVRLRHDVYEDYIQALWAHYDEHRLPVPAMKLGEVLTLCGVKVECKPCP